MAGAVTFEISESDAVAASVAANARRLRQPKTAVVLTVLYLAVIALLAILLGREKLPSLLIAAVIAAPLALAIIRHVLQQRSARAHYHQTAGLHGPFTFKWDQDGFSIEHSKGRATMDWSDLVDVSIRDDVVLLHQSELLYNMVPVRAFTPEQLADLRVCSLAVP